MLNLPLFLLQLAVVIGFAQVLAFVFRKAGQPQVVGEMVAGIALGPTMFGTLAPGPYHALFPVSSLNELSAMSEAGLVIFLFLVGVRVDFAELCHQSKVTVITSISSILVPCASGIGLGSLLAPYYRAQHPDVFALFIGTAMSVTAFPVLARIVAEHSLLDTTLGSVAITCAAVSDLAAWILLATVTALSGVSGARPLLEVLLLSAGFVAVMLALGAVLRAWASSRNREPSLTTVVGFMILALASAAASSWIGIHAFVGAFVAGLITPRVFREALISRLETVTLVLPMPLFFALTGIRTNLLPGGDGIVLTHLILIVGVAIATKWGASLLGARVAGMSWHDSNRLGILMNTRGLVELVILNAGRDSGILSPPIFSMMVCMALLTTVMTTPLLRIAGRSDELSRTVMA